MYLSRIRKCIIASAIVVAAGGSATYAQQAPQNTATASQATQVNEEEAISEASIKKFVKINKDMQSKQMEAQQKMVAVLSEQGMDANRFNELYMAQQQNKLEETKASEDEMVKFRKAEDKINVIQKGLGEEIQSAIQKEGMPQDEFQRIAMAYQQDEQLRTKVDGMMQE